jgi:2'-5' RNA ligase
MRLFFALLPDDNTCDRLSRAAAGLKISGEARLLAPENYHVTLAFIGEVRDGEIDVYREIGASLSLPPCTIELNACEYWPTSQAVVLAARENPLPLAAPADRLRAAVAARMPSRGAERPWRAHATLARKVAQAPVLTAMSPVSWISRMFALMRSAAGGGHAVYTVVDSWSLLDKR